MGVTARSVLLLSLFLGASASYDPEVVEFIRSVLGDKLDEAEDLGAAIGKLLGSGWADRTKRTYIEQIIPQAGRTIDILPRIRTVLDKYGLVPGKEGVPPSYKVDIKIFPAEIRDYILQLTKEKLMTRIGVE